MPQISTTPLQVTKVDMENGVVDLQFSEMVVNAVNLRFTDRKTGEIKEGGATRPEVILRQLTTRPGQVRGKAVDRLSLLGQGTQADAIVVIDYTLM